MSRLDPRNLSAAPTGHRNGLITDWKPYVRDPAIAAREAEVAAYLEQLRARIQADIDAEQSCD